MYKNNTKRFMVIFERWSDRIFNQDVEEFDDLKMANEHVDLISKIYDNSKDVDRFGNEILNGYVVLDFEKEKILKWGKSKRIYLYSSKMDPLALKDVFFRKDGEIPKGYKWDNGEYEGWLRFRWGDGKNAIGYKEDKKSERKKPVINVIDDEEYDEQEMFDKQIEKEKLKRLINRW